MARLGWLGLALAATCCSSVPASAQEAMASTGDWQYGADDELAAASTRNDQGALFGLVCSPDCIGFIQSNQACVPGRIYDGIMRSLGREDRMPLECQRVGGRFALLFTPTSAFVETLRNGPQVTVFVRLIGTTDTAFRFSLNGAYDAIYITLATAVAASNQTPDVQTPGL